MTPDIINGMFELLGAGFAIRNIRQLLQDQVVKGFHWSSTAFWTGWGLWNLYYYPSLGQWMSFWGGVAIVLANGYWLWLVWKFREREMI